MYRNPVSDGTMTVHISVIDRDPSIERLTGILIIVSHLSFCFHLSWPYIVPLIDFENIPRASDWIVQHLPVWISGFLTPGIWIVSSRYGYNEFFSNRENKRTGSRTRISINPDREDFEHLRIQSIKFVAFSSMSADLVYCWYSLLDRTRQDLKMMKDNEDYQKTNAVALLTLGTFASVLMLCCFWVPFSIRTREVWKQGQRDVESNIDNGTVF